MSLGTVPRITAGGFEVDTSEANFGWLRDSNDARSDFEELRRRMASDGYLYLPGFFEREAIRSVRLEICEALNRDGLLDPAFPVEQAISKEGVEMTFRPDIANNPPVRPLLESVIYGPQMMQFCSGFLGGEAMHYDFTWMRAVAPGFGTYPHCDVVYMGRGTKNLYTAWVPFGDVPLNVGGLIVMEGSQHNREIREGYCQLDVDTACTNKTAVNQLSDRGFDQGGALSEDPTELRSHLGCRLLTAQEYRMGDLLLFSVFTVHGSLDNQSREIRISSDSRYQLASDPVDERWIGENPPGHGGSMVRNLIC